MQLNMQCSFGEVRLDNNRKLMLDFPTPEYSDLLMRER